MGDDNSAVVHNGIEEDGGGGQIDQEGQGKGPPNSLSATCVDKGVWKMWLYIWVHCYIHQYRFSVTKEDEQNGP